MLKQCSSSAPVHGYRSTYGEPGLTLLGPREIRQHKGTHHGENISLELWLALGLSIQNCSVTLTNGLFFLLQKGFL